MIPSQISYSASQGAYYIPGQVRLEAWGLEATEPCTPTLTTPTLTLQSHLFSRGGTSFWSLPGVGLSYLALHSLCSLIWYSASSTPSLPSSSPSTRGVPHMLFRHSSILCSQEPQASIRVQALRSLGPTVRRGWNQVRVSPREHLSLLIPKTFSVLSLGLKMIGLVGGRDVCGWRAILSYP